GKPGSKLFEHFDRVAGPKPYWALLAVRSGTNGDYRDAAAKSREDGSKDQHPLPWELFKTTEKVRYSRAESERAQQHTECDSSPEWTKPGDHQLHGHGIYSGQKHPGQDSENNRW